MTKAKGKLEAAPKNYADVESTLTTAMSRSRDAPELVVQMEIISWDLDFDSMPSYTGQEIRRLSVLSHVFRDLMRQWAAHRKAGTEDGGLYSLTRLWALAESPEDKRPGEFVKNIWEADEEVFGWKRVVEDRGADGIWADHEVAHWYVAKLDDKVDSVDIADLIYS
jgi:hypothetical protein